MKYVLLKESKEKENPQRSGALSTELLLLHKMKRNLFKRDIKEAIEIQKKLAKKVSLNSKFHSIDEVSTILGCDIHINEKTCVGAGVVYNYKTKEIIETKTITTSVPSFPYIPGLLAFREGEVLISVIKSIKSKFDILMFDGQGIAHPRGLGIASHIGVILELPTIGCSKNLLYGEYKTPGKEKGNSEYIYDNDKKIGIVLRTKSNVRPIFISPGHMIDLGMCKDIVLACCERFRIPEPLRLAHSLAVNTLRGLST